VKQIVDQNNGFYGGDIKELLEDEAAVAEAAKRVADPMGMSLGGMGGG